MTNSIELPSAAPPSGTPEPADDLTATTSDHASAHALRTGSPTSSSSATPSAARPRCTRCCAAIRRSTCPSSRSPRSSPTTCARAFSAPGRGRCRRRSRSMWLCSRRPVPDSCAGRRRPPTSPPRRRRAASPRLRPDARVDRDPARAGELPALAAPAVAAEPRRDREGSAQGARAGAAQRRQGRRIPRRSPRPQMLLYSEHVRYVEQLRRYLAGARAASGCWCCIYDDFRRDNERTVRGVLRFLDVDEQVPVEPSEANPTVRMRSQRLDDLLHAGLGWRADRCRAPPSGRSRRSCQRRCGPRRCARFRRRFVVGRAGEPRRGADARAAPPLQARGGRCKRVLLDRDLVRLWGYDQLD